MTWAICGAGVLLAALRFGSLKRYFIQLNLPGGLLGVGSVLLAVNVALPLLYRHYVNFKVGVHLDSGPDYEMNERNWLLILPAVLALANFLPRTQEKGNLLPQHRWLPAGMFLLWFIVTGMHLYSLDYIYGYYLRSELFAPVAWVLAWTLYLRRPGNAVWLKYALTVPATLAPLLATSPGGANTFLILAALNLACYGAVSLWDRSNRLAPHLVCASGLLLIGGLPAGWVQFVMPGFDNRFGNLQWVGAGAAAYLVFWIAWLRNPKLAILGSIILGLLIGSLFRDHAGAEHWALQGSLVFLLLHSLRWHDSEHRDANKVRVLAGVAWAAESLVWLNSDTGRYWMPFIPGAIVLAIYFLCFPCRGIWRLFAVPSAATLVILSGPCNAVAEGLCAAPAGLLAVVASFLFLGFGTVAALTRHLWHEPDRKFAATERAPMANR
jgi:hypothetical protein